MFTSLAISPHPTAFLLLATLALFSAQPLISSPPVTRFGTGLKALTMSLLLLMTSARASTQWKTILMLKFCRFLRDKYSLAAVTNDIFTKEDGEFLVKNGALPEEVRMTVITEFAELSGVTISKQWEPTVTHVIASNQSMKMELVKGPSNL